jgi:energy-converting hydrogenase B subunit D
MSLEILNTLILSLLVVVAVLSLWIRDLVVSSVIFGVYSFLMCLLWAEMGAVDVAFTEATVGAGASTVVLIATIFNIKRKAKD